MHNRCSGWYASWNSAFIFEEITATIRQFNPGHEHFKKQQMMRKNLFFINSSLSYLKKGICSIPKLPVILPVNFLLWTLKRGLFRSMVGYSVKQFDLVKNSTHRDKVLLASLNLARAKLFLGEHQDAAKMANYVSSWI